METEKFLKYKNNGLLGGVDEAHEEKVAEYLDLAYTEVKSRKQSFDSVSLFSTVVSILFSTIKVIFNTQNEHEIDVKWLVDRVLNSKMNELSYPRTINAKIKDIQADMKVLYFIDVYVMETSSKPALSKVYYGVENPEYQMVSLLSFDYLSNK